MMMNLFSSFDPSSSMFFPLNWLMFLFVILIFPMNFYYTNNFYYFMFSSMLSMLYYEFSNLMPKKLIQGSMNIIISLFIFILSANLLGLFPFIFTMTSHLMITMMMAFTLWSLFLIFNLINNMKLLMAHLIPLGTPTMLMMFMIMIETISMLIRPITLSVRLSANMIAGHLLLTLLGNSFFSFSMLNYSILYITQIALLFLELAVAFIQTYVFILLIILYSVEI